MEHLTTTALYIRITGPDPKTLKTKHRSFYSVELGKTTLTCSGFVSRRNLVATSGWLVAPFIREFSVPLALIPQCTIDVSGEEGGPWRRAEFVKIAAMPRRVARACKDLVDNDPLCVRGVAQQDVCVLSCDTTGWNAVGELGGSDATAEDRGQALTVVSSAFGLVSPVVFRNSVTRGVLSNVVAADVKEGADLYLTDARCLAGSEGGPVFDSKDRFLGMVLPPLIRKDGGALELGVVLPRRLFWEQVIGDDAESDEVNNPQEPSTNIGTTAAKSVALIRVGANWGSGVLVSKDERTGEGIVATCAHVVNSTSKTSEAVSVSFRGSTSQVVDRLGIVLFCSAGPIDFALIKVPRLPKWLDPVVFANDADFRNGDVVNAVGHAIFEPKSLGGKTATVSSGALSRIVYLEGRPALLQTCASVFRGHSGGMLCDAQGRYMGIITSNAKHSDGSIIPEINFAVPITCVKDFILELATCSSNVDRERLFRKFDDKTNNDAQLRMLWSLQPIESGDGSNPVKPSTEEGKSESFRLFFQRFVESKL